MTTPFILAPRHDSEDDPRAQLADDEIRHQQRKADCYRQAAIEMALFYGPTPTPEGPVLWHDGKPQTLALLARTDAELARI